VFRSLEEGGYQLVYRYIGMMVMCDASDVIEYARRRSELSV